MSADDTAPPTRDALIRAAEILMAEHGIEGAELREINRLAGQRNLSAVHYHFKDRDGLIAAIRDKHRPAIDRHRQQLLDELERRPEITIPDLVHALVEPMAAPLATASGQDFLIIVADAATRTGSRALLETDLPYTDALNRLTRVLLDLVRGNAATRRALVRYAVLTAPVLIADLARDIKADQTSAAEIPERLRTITGYIANGLATP
jgi:AcrR family transcriptional regulator